MEAGKSTVKVPTDSVLSKGSLPVLSSLYLHVAEIESSAVSSFSYKVTNPIIGSTLMTWSKSAYLPKASPPAIITLGIRVSTYEFGEWGDTDIQPIIEYHDQTFILWRYPLVDRCKAITDDCASTHYTRYPAKGLATCRHHVFNIWIFITIIILQKEVECCEEGTSFSNCKGCSECWL